MKLSIIYVSQGGNTEAAAEYIQEGILISYPFAQVKLMDISENAADLKFIAESEAVIFGSPVYFTSMSWELKKWFDNSFKVSLKNKLGAAFVTAQSPLGGTDTAIMEMIRHMLVKGMLVYSGSGQDSGSRFQIGAVALAQDIDSAELQLETFGGCVAEQAVRLINTSHKETDRQ